MNAITQRTPSFFDEFFRDFSPALSPGFLVRPLHGDPLPAPGQIKVDVKESDTAYTVAAEVPGVSRDDIHVTVDGNVVTLRAEIKQEDQQSGDNRKVLRSERYYGMVQRSFQLPLEVDAGGAKARYDNGVLTLTLPKLTSKRSQRLTVE